MVEEEGFEEVDADEAPTTFFTTNQGRSWHAYQALLDVRSYFQPLLHKHPMRFNDGPAVCA